MVSLRFCARVIAAVCTICVLLHPQSQSSRQLAARGTINDRGFDARVESILRKMTLDEKVGQLVQYSAGQPTGPGTGRSDYQQMVARGEIGSFLNVVDPKEINEYQRIATEKSRLH